MSGYQRPFLPVTEVVGQQYAAPYQPPAPPQPQDEEDMVRRCDHCNSAFAAEEESCEFAPGVMRVSPKTGMLQTADAETGEAPGLLHFHKECLLYWLSEEWLADDIEEVIHSVAEERVMEMMEEYSTDQRLRERIEDERT